MTISSTSAKDQHDGNGLSTSFDYRFRILVDADIQVIKTDTHGVDTVLTLNHHYTVTGVGDPAGGSINYPVSGPPLARGEKLTLVRRMDFLQPVDLQNQGGFFPEVLEGAFDRGAMYSLQLQEASSRSLRAPVTDPTAINLTLPSKLARAGTVLGFNSTTGDPEAGPTLADVSSLASITADIATLADIEDGTESTEAIQTCATHVEAIVAAPTHANNAAASATAAAESATSAASEASEATKSATAAAESATSASTAATNATTQATTATAKATTAASSAVAAAASETHASTAANNAAASATSANTAATTATQRANAAATSATAAAASQVAAAASAASAASLYDRFDDRYLGVKAAEPTVDNDGEPLVEGMLYFSSSANKMHVYDGAAWIMASSASDVSLTEFHFISSVAQQRFGPMDSRSNLLRYSVGNLIVILNGRVLEHGTDYTAMDGTSITLTAAAAANDTLHVIAFKPFTTADMVSATAGGVFQGPVAFHDDIAVAGNIAVNGTIDGVDLASFSFDQGDWTPTLYEQESWSAPKVAIDNHRFQQGYYLRVGKWVWVQARVGCFSRVWSGRITVGGLPIPAKIGVIPCSDFVSAGNRYPMGAGLLEIEKGGTAFRIRAFADATGYAPDLSATHLHATMTRAALEYNVSFCYQVA